MYLIRYEKDSLKEYILYKIPDEHFNILVSADNGFQQCYINNDTMKIRLYIKVEVFNMPLDYANEEILRYINKRFNTNDDEWTICVNEKRLLNQHKLSFYYFSNKFCTTLGRIKDIVSKLYHPEFNFDLSVYYTINKKYRELITLILPLQTDYSMKHCKQYTMYFGSYTNTLVDVFDNMTDITE